MGRGVSNKTIFDIIYIGLVIISYASVSLFRKLHGRCFE